MAIAKGKPTLGISCTVGVDIPTYTGDKFVWQHCKTVTSEKAGQIAQSISV